MTIIFMHVIIEKFLAQFELLAPLKNKQGKLLVIDFSPAMIRIVHIELLADRYKLLHYDVEKGSAFEEPIQNTTVNFIKDFLQKHAIHDKDVILSISDADSVVIRYLIIPVLPEAEILEAAKWQLKEEIAFDLENATIDWQVIKEINDEEGTPHYGIIFIIMKREIVEHYLGFITECGLNPIGVTNDSFNYAYLLNHIVHDSSVIAVIDMDFKITTLNVYSRRPVQADFMLNFSRKLPVSGATMTQCLMKISIPETGMIEMSYAKAEEIKHTIGIPQASAQQAKDGIDPMHMTSLLRPSLEALIREIKLSLDYFTGNFEMEKPHHLYITGEGANLKHLESYLSHELSMNVSYLPLLENVHTPQFKKTHSPIVEPQLSLAVKAPAETPVYDINSQEGSMKLLEQQDPQNNNKVSDNTVLNERPILDKNSLPIEINKIIGPMAAVMGGDLLINLLLPEFKTKHIERFQKSFLKIFLLALGGIFFIITFLTRVQIQDLKKRIHYSEIQLTSLKEMEKLKQNVVFKEDLAAQIKAHRIPAEGLLKMLSSAAPEEIILDELRFDQMNHDFMIKGKVLTTQDTAQNLLTDFTQRLESTLFFKKVDLLSSTREEPNQIFEIKCTLSSQ